MATASTDESLQSNGTTTATATDGVDGVGKKGDTASRFDEPDGSSKLTRVPSGKRRSTALKIKALAKGFDGAGDE